MTKNKQWELQIKLKIEKGIINNDNFGLVSKESIYRVSLQAAIWNKDNFIEYEIVDYIDD